MVKIGVMESLEKKGGKLNVFSFFRSAFLRDVDDDDGDDDDARKIYDKFSIKLNYNSHSQLNVHSR